MTTEELAQIMDEHDYPHVAAKLRELSMQAARMEWTVEQHAKLCVERDDIATERDTLRAENERLKEANVVHLEPFTVNEPWSIDDPEAPIPNSAALDRLVEERDKLRAENERLCESLADAGISMARLRAENERLQSEHLEMLAHVTRYRAALEKHGRHSPGCPRFSATFYGQESDEFPAPGVKCTCGLADALGGKQ